MTKFGERISLTWVEDPAAHSRYDEEEKRCDLEVGGQNDSGFGMRHVLGR